MMIRIALMVDGITTGVQVASLSHGFVSIRVIHSDEIVDTFIFLFLSSFIQCIHLYGLTWLQIISSIAILFVMIADIQHRPICDRSNRLSDWLGYLNVAMVHPIGIDGWCLILLMH